MDDILLEGSGTDRRCAGILTADGEKLRARSVVVTTGVYSYICVYIYILMMLEERARGARAG